MTANVSHAQTAMLKWVDWWGKNILISFKVPEADNLLACVLCRWPVEWDWGNGDCDYSLEGSEPVCCRAHQLHHRLVPDQTRMGQPRGAGEHRAEDHWRGWVWGRAESIITCRNSALLHCKATVLLVWNSLFVFLPLHCNSTTTVWNKNIILKLY